ncbi:hypothetical protein NBRC116492_34050 [Aurantivibrio infirmus]
MFRNAAANCRSWNEELKPKLDKNKNINYSDSPNYQLTYLLNFYNEGPLSQAIFTKRPFTFSI